MIPFVKTHALGNDFLLAERVAIPYASDPEIAKLAAKICDRHFGIGADGLITWTRHPERVVIRIFNQDGSEAECSGNGLRCVAAYMIESGRWTRNEIEIETPSGHYRVARIGSAYEADMGVPQLIPSAIPFIPPAGAAIDEVVDFPLAISNGETIPITACSTGNPHCSLFVDRIDDSEAARIGPLLERHPSFPNRTNVEFIHVRNRDEVDVAFWERGVGLTYASGTGSCGATVACILNKRTERRVTVFTKAGQLEVEWPEDGRLKLTSTAQVVAEGNYLES